MKFLRSLPRSALGSLSFSVLMAVVGCGPSFQAIYEGDARFEHCYALEDTPSASMREKTACWRDWSARYTYGQTRDRVDYAAARARALTRVNGAPTDEAMMQAAPGEAAERRGVNAPGPTNAFAPPPKTLADMDGGLLPQETLSTAPAVSVTSISPLVVPIVPTPSSPPGRSCANDCGQGWDTCRATATPEKCQTSYKTCMKGCFK